MLPLFLKAVVAHFRRIQSEQMSLNDVGWTGLQVEFKVTVCANSTSSVSLAHCVVGAVSHRQASLSQRRTAGAEKDLVASFMSQLLWTLAQSRSMPAWATATGWEEEELSRS